MEQIDPRKLLGQIAQILEKLSISYIVTGGMAVVAWGRPRFTADIDTVIELQAKKIEKLAEKLSGLGETGYVNTEAIRDALKTHGEFNFIDGNTGMKVDFWISKNDAFSKSEFKRRIAQNVLGAKIYFVSPEDLILSKFRWHQITPSDRQLEDVESVFKISGNKLDVKYLVAWAKKLGVEKLLSPFLKNHQFS